MEGALWFSQLLFIRQFNQGRQAEDNRQFDYQKAKLVCVGSQTRDIGVAGGHPSRVGAKNKENCFIMLMKKRRMKISIFLK